MNPYNIEPISETDSIAGETPVWDYDRNLLYWTDLLDKKIHCLNADTGEVKRLDVGSKIGTIVLRQNGGLVAALETGFNFVDFESGKIEMILDPEPDRPNNRFNDGKCDCRGRLWISTVSQNFEKGCATMDPLGRVYCLEPDIRVKVILDKVVQVNGMAWSADNKLMYLIDTCSFKIIQFEFDQNKGQVSNPRTAVKIPEDFSYPDGMCMDTEGSLWVGHWGGYQLSRWDPNTGKLLEKVRFPAPHITCCAFGGKEMDELYVTTACFGMSEEEKAINSDAGKLFRLKPGVRGFKAYKFSA